LKFELALKGRIMMQRTTCFVLCSFTYTLVDNNQ
jgi:hypothetical protein